MVKTRNMNAHGVDEGDQVAKVGFEFDHVSNTVFDEIQMVEEQRQAKVPGSQQTSAATPVDGNPKKVVQRPTRPPKKSKTKTPTLGKGKGASKTLSPTGGVRKRTQTEFQEVIEGLGKRTSPVWNEFTIVAQKNENNVMISLHAICKHCKKTDYREEGHYGTSNCRKHLRSCQKYQEWVAKNGDPVGDFNQRKYCSLSAESIMYHGYPLIMVEHEYTRKLHRYLNPKVRNISRTTITRWCMRKNLKLKKILFKTLKELDSKVSLTCDIWTACTSRAYLTLTAHYVDKDWCLKSKVLNFRHFPPLHTGHEVYKLFYSMIKDWGLKTKVMCMTVDNANNNDSMVVMQEESLSGHASLPCEGRHFHIRCSAHILNIIVKDGLKLIDPAVMLVRENVKYIDSSERRMNRFRDCVSQAEKPTSLKLWLDVPTRWNSTYLVCLRALFYKAAMNRFGNTEHGYDLKLTDEQWKSVERMATLHQPFYEITKLFSGSDYPTANLYLEQVCKIQYHTQRARKSDDAYTKEMGEFMYENFDKYWGESSLLLSIASVLDPRHKISFLKHHFSKVYASVDEVIEKIGKVRSALVDLFNHYKLAVGSSTQHTSISVDRTSVGSCSFESDEYESFESAQEVLYSTNLASELDVYLESPLHHVNGSNIDILFYWRDQQATFPIMSKIAKDILAIPITTVASESTFSMGGRILNRWRASLLSRHVEALILTRKWLFGYEEESDEEGLDVGKELAPDAESHVEGDCRPSESSFSESN